MDPLHPEPHLAPEMPDEYQTLLDEIRSPVVSEDKSLEQVKTWLKDRPYDQRCLEVLKLAANSGKEWTTRYLLGGKRGPDILDLRDESDTSVISAAIGGGRLEILQCIIDKLPVRSELLDTPNGEEKTPLRLAVERRSVNQVELLLLHGANLDYRTAQDLSEDKIFSHISPEQLMIWHLREFQSLVTLLPNTTLSLCTLLPDKWGDLVVYNWKISIENLQSEQSLAEVNCDPRSEQSFAETSREPRSTQAFAETKSDPRSQQNFAEISFDPRSQQSFGETGSLAKRLDSGKTWIHVFSTNSIIITAVFRQIQRILIAQTLTLQEGADLMKWFLDTFKAPSFAPSDPFLNYRDPSYTFNDDSSRNGEIYIAIVFPCLVLQACHRHDEDWNKYQQFRRTSSAIGPKIYFERTLAEAYYPGLSSKILQTLNQQQVVLEQPKSVAREVKNRDLTNSRPVLLVPQLWLWEINGFTISAFSMTRSSALFSRTDVDGVESWSLSPTASPRTSQLLEIILDQVNVFGQPQDDDNFPPTLEIFEKAVYNIVSEVNYYVESAAPEKLDITTERELLARVTQIRAEIAMVQEVLGQQNDILSGLLMLPIGRVNEKIGDQAKEQLSKYIKQADKIDRDAERIGQTVKDQLALKRNYASIRDAKTGSILGIAIFGFTIITILFTPLLFFTALFALDIDHFARHKYKDGDDSLYHSSYVGKWFAVGEVISLIVTVLAVFFSLWLAGAVKFSGVRDRIRELSKNYISKMWEKQEKQDARIKSKSGEKSHEQEQAQDVAQDGETNHNEESRPSSIGLWNRRGSSKSIDPES